MSIGDLVTWPWYLGTDWEKTQMQGLIVSSRLVQGDHFPLDDLEEVIVYNVLLTDGTLCDVPENEEDLELVA